MKEKIALYSRMLGDNVMILGHRLSELCGHGPNLETDIALTNISLDLFGQTRNYFQYSAKLNEDSSTEDSIAFLRTVRQYHNAKLTEQPNTDFAFVIARQYLFDAYHLPLLEQLMQSKDTQIAAIAAKSIKEVKYHHRFSSEWVKRLGDGTEESHQRIQTAVNDLLPYCGGLLEESELEKEMKEAGIGADLEKISATYYAEIEALFSEASLTFEKPVFIQKGGKQGMHTEHMGFILADLQYMQRTYPDMAW